MGKRRIDSHVQNSRTIIKNFRKSETDGNTIALDLERWEIDEKKGPNKIGIIYGYYDIETEKFLSDKYETPIGNIIKKMKDYEQTGTINLLSDSEILDIKRFLTMLMIREPSLIDKTVDKTIIARELGIKPTPSKFVRMLEKTELVNSFFDNHYPVMVFNKTSKSYISSIRGFFVWKSTFEELNWWFPVTPSLAIHFVDAGVFDGLYKKNSGAEMPDEKSVEFYNEKIIESAIEQGNKYVFSNTREELDRLMNKYKKDNTPSSNGE